MTLSESTMDRVVPMNAALKRLLENAFYSVTQLSFTAAVTSTSKTALSPVVAKQQSASSARESAERDTLH